MGRGKSKGNSFEREVCKRLSIWWSEGKDDTVFWRSQSSGGRATQRTKRGKATDGQYGDIMADGPLGRILIDLFTIELKRGYNTTSPVELIDRSDSAALQQLEFWFMKLQECLQYSGSFSWWLIHKRDRRKELLYVPMMAADVLKKEGLLNMKQLRDRITVHSRLRWSEYDHQYLPVLVCPLEDWLKAIDPYDLANFAGII